MSAERLQEIFLEAIELDGEARAALLARLRSEDAGLAAELERLLEIPEASPSPIDLPLRGDSGKTSIPARVGPYRILRELGQGGMGRVFLAEQETPDFRRTVALKLIDAPRSDAAAVQRFRDEVRILASLGHPGIVRFYDGGKSADGVWFLALEYVEGVDLLRHAAGAALGVRDRVELLLAVARAVAYAHDKGVVHRDIKPGNVLVGRDGEPRLLDFGISKLLDPADTAATAPTATAFGLRAMTPAYASPEQLSGGSVTAASDVYSLGVMLYELLCGERPPTGGEAIPRPSRKTRRTTSLVELRDSGAGASSASAGAAPLRIDRRLDAICLRALATDAALRYADAGRLASDLEAWLEGASARRGRRRRIALLAAGVLAAATLLVPWAVGRARRSAALADRATGEPSAPDATFPIDWNSTASIEELEQNWSKSPGDVGAGAALVMALVEDSRLDEAEIVVSRLRQVPGRESDPLVDYVDGQIATGRDQYQRALVLQTRALEGAEAAKRHELFGAIRLARGTALLQLGEKKSAKEEFEAARALFEKSGERALLRRTLNSLGLLHGERGDVAAASAAFERALALAEEDGRPALVIQSNYAALLLASGRPDLAEPRLREILAARRAAKQTAREGSASLHLASALLELGRVAEADTLFEASVDLARSAGVERQLGTSLFERVSYDLSRARFDRLEAAIAEIRALSRKEGDRTLLGLAASLEARGLALGGRSGDARAKFAAAQRLLRAENEWVYAVRSDLSWAGLELESYRAGEALRILEEALAALPSPAATSYGVLGELLLVRCELALDRKESARERLAALEPSALSSSSQPRRIAFLAARADLRAGEHRIPEALADLGAALDLARASKRTAEILALRLDAARLERGASRAASLAAIARDAEAAGLSGLAASARR